MQNDIYFKLDEKIKEITSHASLQRLRDHSQFYGFEIAEVEPHYQTGQILSNWMTMIILSGDSLRITFKAFFNKDIGQKILANVLGTQDQDMLSHSNVIDFMKEYCNLTGGYINAILEESGVHVGLSLPLYSRTFYELFFDYQEKTAAIPKRIDFWKLLKPKDDQNEELSIYCGTIVEILDFPELIKLESYEISPEGNEDGEIDFL